jgi:hypothetical protein
MLPLTRKLAELPVDWKPWCVETVEVANVNVVRRAMVSVSP